jgi:Na+-driven multidrug efflux pump
MTRLISSYGAATLAAWSVVQRVARFVQIPSMGLASATPAMVGQNLGAEKPKRAEQAVGLIARAVAATMAAMLLGVAVFAPQVMALFSDDAETIYAGARIVRILSLGYLLLAVNGVYDAAQGGAGDTASPMAINMAALWLVQVPLAYLLARALGMGADGVWAAMVIGWLVQAALMVWRYRQGRWKLTRI